MSVLPGLVVTFSELFNLHGLSVRTLPPVLNEIMVSERLAHSWDTAYGCVIPYLACPEPCPTFPPFFPPAPHLFTPFIGLLSVCPCFCRGFWPPPPLLERSFLLSLLPFWFIEWLFRASSSDGKSHIQTNAVFAPMGLVVCRPWPQNQTNECKITKLIVYSQVPWEWRFWRSGVLRFGKLKWCPRGKWESPGEGELGQAEPLTG